MWRRSAMRRFEWYTDPDWSELESAKHESVRLMEPRLEFPECFEMLLSFDISDNRFFPSSEISERLVRSTTSFGDCIGCRYSELELICHGVYNWQSANGWAIIDVNNVINNIWCCNGPFHCSWKVTQPLHETEAKFVLAQLEKWK